MKEQIFYDIDELDNLADNEQVILFDENGYIVTEGYYRKDEEEGYIESMDRSSVTYIESKWYVMKRTPYYIILRNKSKILL